MNDQKKPTIILSAISAILLFASFVVVGVLLLVRAGYIRTTTLAEKIDNIFGSEGIEGIIPDGRPADEVGVEVYDLSVYEQNEEAIAEALSRVEESDFIDRRQI